MTNLKIEEHRLFKKYYKKLSAKEKVLYKQRIKILQENIKHPLLKVHPLRGNLNGLFAFSLSGDLRVIFMWKSRNHIVLYKIGTHNQVY